MGKRNEADSMDVRISEKDRSVEETVEELVNALQLSDS